MVNRDQIKYLLIGILIGVFSIKSTELSWSTAQETMNQISSVDARIAVTNIFSDAASAAASSETVTDGDDSPVNKTGAAISAPASIEEVTVPPKPPDTAVLNATAAQKESTAASSNSRSSVAKNEMSETAFTHHPGVVIAVKIHGHFFIPEIKQSFCLLHAAYNNRVLYDVVIFATIKLPEDEVAAIQKIIYPAKLIVQYDEQTLEQQIADMTPAQQDKLVNRCDGVNRTEDLTWHHRCKEGKFVTPIAYCWMSEFRSKHIWHQKVLAPYKYMMWYDSDSFATQVWHKDPVDFMITNDLVLLSANYPQGTTRFKTGVQSKLFQVYNKTFCGSQILPNGRLNVTYGGEGECRNAVMQVHGFFHITNLDFYRLPINLHWSDIQIGDNKFSRIWDDQLAVAVPPSMLAPNRLADMEPSGLKLEVMHNGMIMGRRKWVGGAYKKFFRKEGLTKFPEAQKKCKAFITVGSR